MVRTVRSSALAVGIAVVLSGVLAGAALGGEPEGDLATPTNERGQTYGSALDAASPSDEPDLVLIVMDGGGQGYVYGSGLETPEFETPQAALAWQQAHPGGYTLPAYAADGVTEIGTFTVSP